MMNDKKEVIKKASPSDVQLKKLIDEKNILMLKISKLKDFVEKENVEHGFLVMKCDDYKNDFEKLKEDLLLSTLKISDQELSNKVAQEALLNVIEELKKDISLKEQENLVLEIKLQDKDHEILNQQKYINMSTSSTTKRKISNDDELLLRSLIVAKKLKQSYVARTIEYDCKYGNFITPYEYSRKHDIKYMNDDEAYKTAAVLNGYINDKVELINDIKKFPNLINIANLLLNFLSRDPGKSVIFLYQLINYLIIINYIN